MTRSIVFSFNLFYRWIGELGEGELRNFEVKLMWWCRYEKIMEELGDFFLFFFFKVTKYTKCFQLQL